MHTHTQMHTHTDALSMHTNKHVGYFFFKGYLRI